MYGGWPHYCLPNATTSNQVSAMAHPLEVFTTERLDVVLHRGNLEEVVAQDEDVRFSTTIEVVSPDGRWCLLALLDVTRCRVSANGTWVLAFDRRSAKLESLPVARVPVTFLHAVPRG